MRRRRDLRRLWRRVKWPLVALLVLVLLLLAPVAYVELACQDGAVASGYTPLIADPRSQRREANTYLTYPEWHIVFAYDGLAETLKTGDEHAFGYLRSIAGFWRATCTLTRIAGQHGGADGGTRSMIATIGVSFTAEMLAKAAYEETIGRVTAWIRGPRKTRQDETVGAVAADYARFLRQTPWYEYPFHRRAQELWAVPVESQLRGWERRLGIGLEFEGKAVYAKVLAGAVAATEAAPLTIRSVVAGSPAADLAQVQGVTVIGEHAGGIEIETPRYAAFTRIVGDIVRRRGTVREIAGNDEIMASLTVREGTRVDGRLGTVLLRMKRDGRSGERLLLNVRVPDLHLLLAAYPVGDPGLEHLFDY